MSVTVLCILDGLGLNPNPKANAFAMAQAPTLKGLISRYPSSTLRTDGEYVGLPAGTMGNSEVGHLNIGAGRVVEQWLVRISRELKEGCLDRSDTFQNFLGHVGDGSAVHLIGLFSDGGVHSHSDHLFAVIKKLLASDISKVVIHLITDGRDTAPTAALEQVRDLLAVCKNEPRCVIGSISGRYYAMDRDKRWQRTEKAWRVIALGEGERVNDVEDYIRDSYEKGITDEFLEPVVVECEPVKEGDSILFFNFRADRMRQLVSAFHLEEFPHFHRGINPLPSDHLLSFTEYDTNFTFPFIFSNQEIRNHLGEYLSRLGIRQLRTAETEKYPHVTYFFNGMVEEPFKGEDRKLIPSPRDIKTYDLKPEMSAYPVKDIVIDAIKSGAYGFIVVNFANCDMVGHTGVIAAAIKAVETVDACVREIVAALDAAGGRMLLIADHGNCELMEDPETGKPHTAHTTFPVPVVLYGYGTDITLREGGALCDVAPTLLHIMEIDPPEEMEGKSLIF